MPTPPLSSLIKRAEGVLEQRKAVALTVPQIVKREIRLAPFVRDSWPILEPATPFIDNWHVDVVCEHLEALVTGALPKNNLAIAIPPGSAKSTLVSVCLPAWCWITRPATRFIFASGSLSVSMRDSLRCRALIESDWYRNSFGIKWALAEDQNSKGLYRNDATGFRMATTAGSRITGDRADILVCDDPLDAAEAYSKPARDAVLLWYDQAFGNRLNDLRTGKRILIQQRLHIEDLIGHVLELEAAAWEHLMIPMLFEQSRRYTTGLGWTDPRQSDGELLFPERFPQHVVDSEKVRLGSSAFAGQMQQRPSQSDGEIFKTGNAQFVVDVPPLTQVILSLDTAFTTKQTGDYSVCVVAGQCDFGVIILDIIRGRYAYPQLQALAEQLALTWHPAAVLVEDAASGKSLIQSLQQTTSLPVVPVKVDGDKVTRAHIVVPTWEARRVYFVLGPDGQPAPWAQLFLEELYSFPKGKNDDQVDAFVQAVRYLQYSPGAGLFEYYRNHSALPVPEAPQSGWPAVTSTTMAQRVQREGLVVVDQVSPWH